VSNLKITILTPSFNQGEYIEQTIRSVINQDVKEVEHIVIDGGSTDNTISILKKYPNIKWVSEVDRGQSDALNKGLKMATGDIIGWLNSDDYYKENIFKEVISLFRSPDVQWIIGNSYDYYTEYDLFRKVNSKEISYKYLLSDSERQNQPPTFFRKNILEKVEGFNSSFHYVMDYDLWIRLSSISKPKMVNTFYAVFRRHHAQKTNKNNMIGFINEINIILKREKVSWLKREKILFFRRKGRIKYYIKNILIKYGLMDKKYLNINYSSRHWIDK
jgi:glycosyltransferase involved in cell wall biosynthesis